MAQSGIVTFLFTDLIQSTEHLQRAGDEAGQQLFRAHHRLMTQAVTANGGEELEWLGDGILAAFSSASDAVRCAISVQQTARRPAAGARFEIRIGIHAGEALRREGGYFGTPVVTARRLCDRAVRGQILCSRLILELLSARRGFNFHDLGSLELKGLTTPLGVAEVTYERNDPSVLLNRTPFVGRTSPLQRLTAKLEEACNGQGGVAMLLGEPGIGKTRMLEEFGDVVRQNGGMMLRGACYDGEWQRPYGPFAEIILEYARTADPTELKLIDNSAPILARVAPALRDRLGNIVEPVSLDKEEERFRLFDAISQMLIGISQRRPLVVVLDDLHWADRGTAAMLNHVAHFVPDNPVLLIGAYREGEVDRKHPLAGTVAAVRRLRNFESLPLKGLAGEDVADLLGMIGDEEAPEGLVKTLTTETGGNPFFIRELLLHLREQGKILSAGHCWNSAVGVAELGITEGVREVVRQRLNRLSEETNRLLTVGAAFNGAFSFEVAAAVAELDEQAALEAVDEALEAQLLRPGTNPDSFDFTHATIRHTLYSELNPVRRVRQHRRIAEQMERAWGERAAEHAAEVAYQFWRGAAVSGTERGVDYAVAAADNAESAYAFDEVTAFLRIALEMMPEADPRRPRLLARLGLGLVWRNDEDVRNVTQKAGELIAANESPEAAATYLATVARAMYAGGLIRGAWDTAADGLRYAGDRHDIVWAGLQELDLMRQSAEDPSNPGVRIDTPGDRELRKVLGQLPLTQLRAYGLEQPFESRLEVIQADNPTPIALLFLAGEIRESLPLWRREAAEAELQGRIVWAMTSWASVARCHIALGEFTAGQAAYDRASALSNRSAGPSPWLLNLLSAQQDLRMALDDGWEEVLSDPRIISLMQQPTTENQWASAPIRAAGSYLFSRINQPDLALQRYLSLLPAIKGGAGWTYVYSGMACDAASTLWFLNRTDSIEVVEKNLRDKVVVPDFRYPMRDSRLSLARLCALQGRYTEAREWFAKARAVLDEQGARPLRAIVDFDEALMYQRNSADVRRVQPLLKTATDQFKTLGMTGWLRRGESQSFGSQAEL
jgi:class 3 adenylate cyclase/tetratricopeptide (TPR) repeat protein